MNIQEATVNELKSYIESLMLRYAAIAGHFGLVMPEKPRAEPLASYFRDAADLVEMSRLSQLALARLIEMDGPNVEQFITQRTLHNYYPQLDNPENIEPKKLRSRFLELMHMSSGHALSTATSFPNDVSTGLVIEEEIDHSETYTRYRTELAEIHQMSLKAQIALTHLLRAHNEDKYRSGL